MGITQKHFGTIICNFLYLFRPQEDQECVTLRAHSGAVYGVCFIHDSQHVLSCSEDKTGMVQDALVAVHI